MSARSFWRLLGRRLSSWEAHHRLGVGVDRQAVDHAVRRARLLQDLEEDLDQVGPAVGHRVKELLAGHG
jgi:hypothetical protein